MRFQSFLRMAAVIVIHLYAVLLCNVLTMYRTKREEEERVLFWLNQLHMAALQPPVYILA